MITVTEGCHARVQLDGEIVVGRCVFSSCCLQNVCNAEEGNEGEEREVCGGEGREWRRRRGGRNENQLWEDCVHSVLVPAAESPSRPRPFLTCVSQSEPCLPGQVALVTSGHDWGREGAKERICVWPLARLPFHTESPCVQLLG